MIRSTVYGLPGHKPAVTITVEKYPKKYFTDDYAHTLYTTVNGVFDCSLVKKNVLCTDKFLVYCL